MFAYSSIEQLGEYLKSMTRNVVDNSVPGLQDLSIELLNIYTEEKIDLNQHHNLYVVTFWNDFLQDDQTIYCVGAKDLADAMGRIIATDVDVETAEVVGAIYSKED
jgi:hypothetical protein